MEPMRVLLQRVGTSNMFTLRLVQSLLPPSAFALLVSSRFLLCPLSLAALQLSLVSLSGLAIRPPVGWGGREDPFSRGFGRLEAGFRPPPRPRLLGSSALSLRFAGSHGAVRRRRA